MTDFGDSAVTLPLAGLVAVGLIVLRRPGMALAWAVGIAGCGAAVALFKLAVHSCGSGVSLAGLPAPSGHTAMGVSVYAGLAVLLTVDRPFLPALAVRAAGVAFAVAVGVSRVVLGAHTVPETLFGLIIGGLSVAVLGRRLRRNSPMDLSAAWLCLACALAVGVMHGSHWPVEQILRSIAVALRGTLPQCG